MNTLTLFPILTVLTVVIDAVSVSGAEPVDTVLNKYESLIHHS